jgi:hypothetical protein
MAEFEKAARLHAASTETGDYKAANSTYKKIIKLIELLKSHQSLNELIPYMEHENAGVRLWAVTYSLTTNETAALKALSAIAKNAGIHSLTAQTTISEWKKGNLKF